jgi:hypothetical protein
MEILGAVYQGALAISQASAQGKDLLRLFAEGGVRYLVAGGAAPAKIRGAKSV